MTETDLIDFKSNARKKAMASREAIISEYLTGLDNIGFSRKEHANLIKSLGAKYGVTTRYIRFLLEEVLEKFKKNVSSDGRITDGFGNNIEFARLMSVEDENTLILKAGFFEDVKFKSR